MNMPVSQDGKFFDRLLPALLAATIAVGGTAVVFWRDSAVADSRAMIAIARLDRDVDEIKRRTAADREKTANLSSDVKVLLAITQRVEKAVSEMNMREKVSP